MLDERFKSSFSRISPYMQLIKNTFLKRPPFPQTISPLDRVKVHNLRWPMTSGRLKPRGRVGPFASIGKPVDVLRVRRDAIEGRDVIAQFIAHHRHNAAFRA